MVAPRLDLLPAQSETPDASPVMLVDKRKAVHGVMTPRVWLPDLTEEQKRGNQPAELSRLLSLRGSRTAPTAAF